MFILGLVPESLTTGVEVQKRATELFEKYGRMNPWLYLQSNPNNGCVLRQIKIMAALTS